jgi:hypothetical protein
MSTTTGFLTGSITGTEDERGTYVGTRHHHNGYYAGDFSGRPFPTAPLADLMTMRAASPAGSASTVGGGW